MFALVLFACADLSGEWSGTLDCVTSSGNYTSDITFTLDPADGQFEGDGDDYFQFDGYSIDVVFNIDIDRPDHGGAQDLDVDAVSESCTYAAGGLSYETECTGYTLADTTVSWDGGDQMVVDPDDGDCDGELTRQR